MVHWGVKIEPWELTTLKLEPSGFQGAPRCVQGQPKWTKLVPREGTRSLRGPQDGPKGLQEDPRRSKGAQREPKGSQKGAQMEPKGNPRSSKGVKVEA